MSYTVEDFAESLDRLSKSADGFDANDVVACWGAWGEDGDYAEWEGGFILCLRDGRFALLTGWCDTTGWGCQDGIETRIANSVGELNVTEARDKEYDGFPADLNRWLDNRNKEERDE